MSNTLIILVLVTSILSILLAIGAIIMSSMALLKALATEKATHSVQFMPIEDNLKDNWSTSEASLKKQADLYKKDVEENLPDFADNEEATKPYSF